MMLKNQKQEQLNEEKRIILYGCSVNDKKQDKKFKEILQKGRKEPTTKSYLHLERGWPLFIFVVWPLVENNSRVKQSVRNYGK